MFKPSITLLSAAVCLALTGCAGTADKAPQQVKLLQDKQYDNALLKPFSGPYQGVPHFDKMDLALLEPAVDIAMADNLKEIEAIANNPAKPTFENTIVALEKSGAALDRIFTYYGIWSANLSSPEFRDIQSRVVPKYSAYSSKITQNTKLFKRIQAVYEGEEFQKLTPEEQRITKMRYDGFARNGATLTGDDAKRYAEINLELSKLHTKFANNVLADEENYVVYLTEEQLSGLPESFITSAAAAAKARGKEGMYAITNSRSSMDPFLTYSTEREIREKVWNNYYNRGNNGDEADNKAIISEILKLRHERVNLLGYDNYAAWRLEDRMAKKPDNAMALMKKVWPAAIARVEQEVADMQAIADKEGADITIKPWDYRFYAEKVRQAKYQLDSNEVKAYLQLDKLREAMFYVAGRLFNFEFTPVAKGTVPVFHPDVKVWEVTDKTTGENVGLWYLDPFARKGKRSGAWAVSYRSHTTFDGKQNVLSSNNSNFVKAPELSLIHILTLPTSP